jgi:hypothetical protein
MCYTILDHIMGEPFQKVEGMPYPAMENPGTSAAHAIKQAHPPFAREKSLFEEFRAIAVG